MHGISCWCCCCVPDRSSHTTRVLDPVIEGVPVANGFAQVLRRSGKDWERNWHSAVPMERIVAWPEDSE